MNGRLYSSIMTIYDKETADILNAVDYNMYDITGLVDEGYLDALAKGIRYGIIEDRYKAQDLINTDTNSYIADDFPVILGAIFWDIITFMSPERFIQDEILPSFKTREKLDEYMKENNLSNKELINNWECKNEYLQGVYLDYRDVVLVEKF